MSTFEMAYLGMVICGMTLFLVVLAWGCWHTRSRASETKTTQTTAAVRPSESNRLTA